MGRILIVEDDRPFADALAFTLRLEGHEVLVAVSPDEGILLGLTRHPDLVIADWMLKSDMHGGEVCRQIVAVWPLVKTIIMTGYLNAVSQVSQFSEFGDAVIEKPFHKERLLDAVNRALATAPQEQQTVY